MSARERKPRTHREERERRRAARIARAEKARAGEAARAKPASEAESETTAPEGGAAATEVAPEPTTEVAPVVALPPSETTVALPAASAPLPVTAPILAQPARRRPRPDAWIWPLVGVIGVVLSSAFVISEMNRPPVAARPVGSVTTRGVPSVSAEALVPPTPCFARYYSVVVRLPVAPESITTVAFHQAALKHARHLESLVAVMPLGAALKSAKLKAYRAKKRNGSAEATPAPLQTDEGIWTGKVIRLWRSGRSGRPDTAVDVGAKPGTRIVTPVDGVVTLVKRYKLYNKYPDYEIHIAPEGTHGIEMVVIHLADPAVMAGDVVDAGITPIGRVRHLSKYVDLQLREYSADKGDHCHIQMNLLEPRRKAAATSALPASASPRTR